MVELAKPSGLVSTIRLRPMTGQDELMVNAADSTSVLSLLSCLATDENGGSLDLGQLDISQVDRLLAGLYEVLYGDQAECRVHCRFCGEGYEFSLILSELMATQDAARPEPPGPDGTWTLPDLRRVRAPKLIDITSVPDLESLLARLVVSGDPSLDSAMVTDFLERAAPLLNLDLEAVCPHCEQEQIARFDLARYFASRLAGERSFLLREAHLIASHYGWSHHEIMILSRTDRRAYARLIEAERTGARPIRSVR